MSLKSLKNKLLVAMVLAGTLIMPTTALGDPATTPANLSTTASQTETVTDFASIMTLDHRGTLDVQENFTYDFGITEPHAVSYRFLTGYTDDQGNPLSGKLVLLGSMLDNKAIKLTPDTNGSYASINLPAGTGTSPRQYSLHYTLTPAVLAGPDADVFKFSVTGLAWSVPINQATVTFHSPGLKPQSLTCYTGTSGSTTSSCRITENGTTSTIVTDTTLAPGESLSLYTGFPLHSFANYYNSWDARSLWTPLLAIGVSILFVGVVITVAYRRRGRRRKAHSEQPENS